MLLIDTSFLESVRIAGAQQFVSSKTVCLQFVLHAALDAVDEQQWTTTTMHLGVVDKFHNLQVGHSKRHCNPME